LSLTQYEVELVQSFQSSITEGTLSREILAEELLSLSDSPFFDDNALFAFRLMLNVGLNPGATARDLSKKLGEEKQRTVERLLAKFREMGVLEAWNRVPKGQWAKPHTRRKSKGGPVPMQYWLTGDLNSPAFQELDLETRKSLWKARKFITSTPFFRESLRRSIIATTKIVEATGPRLKPILEKIPEMKLLSKSLKEPSVHPRLPLEDEAAAYAATRMLFVQPSAEEETLPLGESKRLSLL